MLKVSNVSASLQLTSSGQISLGGFGSPYIDQAVGGETEVKACLNGGARCYQTGSDHIVEEKR
jgi:hypothetical protein